MIVSINRLRHKSLKASLFKFKIVDSPLCETCGEEETPNHIFWRCPKYSEPRGKLYSALIRIRGLFPHSVEYLLATIKKNIIYVLSQCINSIKIDTFKLE